VLQNADLFYFAGSIQQGALYVPVTGEPLYMVRREYTRARMESGLKEIVPIKSHRDIPAILNDFNCPLPQKAGMELDVLPVNLFSQFTKTLKGCIFSDAGPLIRSIRAVKSAYEIEILKDAAVIADKINNRAKEVIRPGITDLEVDAELQYVARKWGHQGIIRMRGFNSEIFYGRVFSGPDSAAPAYLDVPLGGIGLNPSVGQGASYKRIEANQPVVVDFCGAFDGYVLSQTRTFCIGGLSDKLKKAYEDMVRIQERFKEIARPGAMWSDLYDDCCNLACELGYKDHFMGFSGAQVSFIGHGVGIEIDEYPCIARGFNDQVLKENMIVAFEPKAVYPGLGAVGIENTFWVCENGPNQLTFSSEELRVL